MKLKDYLTIYSIFIFTKILLYFVIGINPNIDIYNQYQLLNKQLLSTDLIQSLYFFHYQPFLWNLFIGVLTKIFNSNEYQISIFLLNYHILLSGILIFLFIKICEIYNLSKFKTYIIVFLIILNPSIVFFENMPLYGHTTLILFTLISYLLLKYFKDPNYKCLIYIYLNLTLLTFIWSAFHPIILLIFFLLFQFLEKKINRKKFFIFVIFFTISLIPSIKNKILFKNSTSSVVGYVLTIHIPENYKKEFCRVGPTIPVHKGSDVQNYFKTWYPNHKILYVKDSKKYIVKAIIYKDEYPNKKKILNHKSLFGPLSGKNNIGTFYRSKLCKEEFFDFIKKEPLLYGKIILMEFLSTHGQWITDLSYIISGPKEWDKISRYTKKIQDTKKLKIIRQILNIGFMFALYIYFFVKIFYSNISIYKRNSLIMSLLLYFFILLVGTIMSKYEGVRFIYTGYSIILLFIVNLLSKKHHNTNR